MTEDFRTFRDPLLSVYQSMVSEVARKIDSRRSSEGTGTRRGLQRSASVTLPILAAEIAQRESQKLREVVPPVKTRSVPRELSKSGIAKVCAELGWRYIKALANNDNEALSQIQGEYTASTCDLAWITTLEEYHRYVDTDGRRKAIPYIRASQVGSHIIEIKPNAQLVLASDWGTGASPAIEVLKLIAAEKADIFVHLGDVYYSGTLEECQARFLSPVNQILRASKAEMPVFALSGNHDMYCGGIGYYDLVGKLNKPPYKQEASFFCLRSTDEKWQLLAMDTGLHDDNPAGVTEAVTWIEEDELEWHCQRIEEFAGRTILLSHHQLFSAFSPIGAPSSDGHRSALNPLLLDAYRKMTQQKQVAAWFWGHEHTLSIYKAFAGLERGRCIGHGAVPVSVQDEIYKPLPDLEETPALLDTSRLSSRGGVYNHGYALLKFDGDQCHASYIQAGSDGRQLVFDEVFT